MSDTTQNAVSASDVVYAATALLEKYKVDNFDEEGINAKESRIEAFNDAYSCLSMRSEGEIILKKVRTRYDTIPANNEKHNSAI